MDARCLDAMYFLPRHPTSLLLRAIVVIKTDRPHEGPIYASRSTVTQSIDAVVRSLVQGVRTSVCTHPPSHSACPLEFAPLLVADFDQVVSQLLHRICCRAGLDALRVVRNEDCLCGFDDDDAFSALQPTLSLCLPRYSHIRGYIALTFFP